jgi:pyridoxine 5-phosphate synthase
VPIDAWGVAADRIELYTGPYGGAFEPRRQVGELAKLAATADAARQLGGNGRRGGARLEVNAGHDLTLDNLPPLVAAIPDLAEVSIGHAITADALILGFAEATRRYKAALAGGP